MKDTAGRAGGLFMGRIILTGISKGMHKFTLEYFIVEGSAICFALCACGHQAEIVHFENYGGAKEVQYEWERHIGSKSMVNESA